MAATGDEATKEQRVYRGLTGEQRRERRRNQLIDAGLELFGTVGYQGTSIRGVVRESGLIERYFYESFANLDELFGAVYERIRHEIFGAVMDAVIGAGEDHEDQIRAGIGAFFTAVTSDPRYARIKLIEEAGIKYKLEARRAGGADSAVEYIASLAPPSETLDAKSLAVGLIGAVHEMLTRWYHGELDISQDSLVDQCTALFLGVEHVYVKSLREGEGLRSVAAPAAARRRP